VEACSLVNHLILEPDPFAAGTPAAKSTSRQALKIARVARPALCPGGKAEVIAAADGSQYFGQSRNGAPEGQGVRFYPDGARYIGSWKAGVRRGQGLFLFANGSRYVGAWVGDKAKGKGVLQYRETIKTSVVDPKKAK
jgi:hypothetical protein